MYVTNHAIKRTRERKGQTKKSAIKDCGNALQYGVYRQETSGSVRRYLDKLYFQDDANKIVVWKNSIYIFKSEDVLVTVLTLPAKYQHVIAKIKRRKEENE